MSTFNGTKGNDDFTGTSSADTFNLSQGGNDTANGGGGNDTFNFGATFAPGDFIDGGTGNDTLSLAGDYSEGLTITSAMMVSVENIKLAAGHTYALTLDNSAVTIGHSLTVDASALAANNRLLFDGTSETTSSYDIIGGKGKDIIYGGAADDTIDLSKGGDDQAFGGAGNDTFVLAGALTAADRIDGGSGSDTLELNGDYTGSHKVVFNASTLSDVETIVLGAGHSYNLTLGDDNMPSGGKLTVDASALGGSNTFSLDLSDITGGSFRIAGGAGADTFSFGGDFNTSDRIAGGLGNDTVSLDGDYSAGLVIAATTISSVETIDLAAGNDYAITTRDGAVAAGSTLTVDGSALGTTDALTFNGTHETDGVFDLIGGAGDDALTGGAMDDVFDLSHGGNDSANGGDGDDTFEMGGALTGADSLNGGNGDDTVVLNGNYGAEHDITGSTLTNIETVQLDAGHDYNLHLNGVVAMDHTLTVNASALGAGDSLNFVCLDSGAVNVTLGAADSTVQIANGTVTAGSGSDAITIGTGTVDATAGGNVAIAITGSGTAYFGAAFTAADSMDGYLAGSEMDLNGDYSSPTSLANVIVGEIRLGAGHNYDLFTTQSFFGAFDEITLSDSATIDGSALGASNTLTFDGSSITGATTIYLYGGSGNDVLIGGGSSCFLVGGRGADTLTGSSGMNFFSYNSVMDSTGSGYDTITNFDSATDRFAFSGGGLTNPVAIDPAVTTGTLNSGANFDSNLASAVGSGQLTAGDAVLFTPSAGSLSGHTFLIVDVNGTAGYQAEHDLVIDVTGITGSLTTANFL